MYGCMGATSACREEEGIGLGRDRLDLAAELLINNNMCYNIILVTNLKKKALSIYIYIYICICT